jgi:hypothetical protein
LSDKVNSVTCAFVGIYIVEYGSYIFVMYVYLSFTDIRKGCQRREYQNYGMDTTGEKEKRTPKENVDGKTTSSHDDNKF